MARPSSKPEIKQEPSNRAVLVFSPTRYRVKASDQRAEGASFASALFGNIEDAWQMAEWLRAQGDRFRLIRIEAAREAMAFPPAKEEGS